MNFQSLKDPKIAAFVGFVAIRVALGLVYKFASSKGKYEFSPNSSIAIAEFMKMTMSFAFAYSTEAAFPTSTDVEQNRGVLIAYAFLGLVYAINNQITFYVLATVDPATLELFKSMSPFVVLLFLWAFTTERVSVLQWVCILLQCTGLILMTVDSCTAQARLPFNMYIVLLTSLCLTSASSVVNMKLIKGCPLSMHVQNVYLYFWGVVFNVGLFVFFPTNDIGFFTGYTSSVWPVCVLLCNAFIGIAITAVYRYADVVVKTFANAAALCILVYFSSMLFGLDLNLPTVVATLIVVTASWLYFIVHPNIKKLEESKEGWVPSEKHSMAVRMTVLLLILSTIVFGVSSLQPAE